MAKEFKSVEKLEIGKDYINRYGGIIVIDRKGRKGNYEENGFYNIDYRDDLFCVVPDSWREATPEEVKERFEAHLVKRYGEDWETMKIKENHPSSTRFINNKSYKVGITKFYDGWNVWNENGLLYCDGIWAERLEEKEKNKIMKKYRLKKWYPSLAISWSTDDRYEYDANNEAMTNISNVKNGLAMPKQVIIKKAELHPDFWELIEEKKPLFVTEDGVEVIDDDTLVFVVKDDFKKSQRFALAFKQNKSTMKSFFLESNADEYIWRNKRLFSYNDIEKYQSGGEGVFYDVKAIAKGRSKE